MTFEEILDSIESSLEDLKREHEKLQQEHQVLERKAHNLEFLDQRKYLADLLEEPLDSVIGIMGSNNTEFLASTYKRLTFHLTDTSRGNYVSHNIFYFDDLTKESLDAWRKLTSPRLLGDIGDYPETSLVDFVNNKEEIKALLAIYRG